MSNAHITELVAVGAGLVVLTAFVGLVMVPVVSSYERIWERFAAGLLSLWILGALVGVGVLGGAAVIWFWPRIF